MFVQVFYVMFLVFDQVEKQCLFEEVIDYIEQVGLLVKVDIVVQFGSVYVKVCLVEELLVLVVFKCGYISEIFKELDVFLVR